MELSKRKAFAKQALQVKADAEGLFAILGEDACEGLECLTEKVPQSGFWVTVWFGSLEGFHFSVRDLESGLVQFSFEFQNGLGTYFIFIFEVRVRLGLVRFLDEFRFGSVRFSSNGTSGKRTGALE